MKKVKLYTDGSSLGNPGFGGWGVVLEYNGIKKEFSGSKENVTNNQMEILAVIEGLKKIKESCEIDIYSDSSYVVNSINKWISNWEKSGWKNGKVKNIDLWKEYLNISKQHNIKANWVRGHNGHIENERCDALAVKEAKKLKQKAENGKTAI